MEIPQAFLEDMRSLARQKLFCLRACVFFSASRTRITRQHLKAHTGGLLLHISIPAYAVPSLQGQFSSGF